MSVAKRTNRFSKPEEVGCKNKRERLGAKRS